MNLMSEAQPHIAKQACYICSRRNNVVDLDVFIEGEGVLGICVEHLVEGIRAAGLEIEDPEVLDRLITAEADVEELSGQLADANAVILEMVNAGRQAAEQMKPSTS